MSQPMTPSPRTKAVRLPAMFTGELCRLLNKHSVDNEVGMPDFILAELLTEYIESLAVAQESYRRWRE